MRKKALILYASITGNTQQIAEVFRDVCNDYNFETDMVKIEPKHDWDKDPVFIRQYDLVLLGSPVIAGLPFNEVNQVMGLQSNKWLCGLENMKNSPPPHTGDGIPGVVEPPSGTNAPGSKGETCKTNYGIVFVTYGGSGVGPAEAIGALETEVEHLRVNGVRTVGKFACCGKELRHESVDMLADRVGINIDEAQAMLQRFITDPNAQEFAKFQQPVINMLKKLSGVKDEDSFGEGFRMLADNDPLGCGKPGCRMWHYDFEHRPNKRDLTKARIFLEEIIEDHFLTVSGDPRAPYSTYISIA